MLNKGKYKLLFKTNKVGATDNLIALQKFIQEKYKDIELFILVNYTTLEESLSQYQLMYKAKDIDDKMAYTLYDDADIKQKADELGLILILDVDVPKMAHLLEVRVGVKKAEAIKAFNELVHGSFKFKDQILNAKLNWGDLECDSIIELQIKYIGRDVEFNAKGIVHDYNHFEDIKPILTELDEFLEVYKVHFFSEHQKHVRRLVSIQEILIYPNTLHKHAPDVVDLSTIKQDIADYYKQEEEKLGYPIEYHCIEDTSANESETDGSKTILLISNYGFYPRDKIYSGSIHGWFNRVDDSFRYVIANGDEDEFGFDYLSSKEIPEFVVNEVRKHGGFLSEVFK